MIWRILFIFSLFTQGLWAREAEPGKVLVSIAPHRFFVEQIGGEHVLVKVMVPAGASAHTFEPTVKQVLAVGNQQIWFRMGESFEEKALPALRSHYPGLEMVDLREGLALIGCAHCCCGHGGADPHIWLSARLAEQQARTIAEVLGRHYPEHRETFEKNLQVFLEKLRALDGKMEKILAPMQQRTLVVSHPAYGYLCRDYNLKQLSVEFEGKDPSPRQLTDLLVEARQMNIQYIFVQEQHSSKGARLLAKELGAEVVVLNPYSADYLINMRLIAQSFAKQK